MRWLYGLAGALLGIAAAYLLLIVPGLRKYVPLPVIFSIITSEAIVDAQVQSYVPAGGGTVNWQTMDLNPPAPLQLYWLGPQPCTSPTSSGTSVSCSVAAMPNTNNTFGYRVGPPNSTPQPPMHIMRVGACNNCSAVLNGYTGGTPAYNVVYCDNTVPAVQPENIAIAKSGTVTWTVLGSNNPQATISFVNRNPCAPTGSRLTDNKPFCKVIDTAAGPYSYTVSAITSPSAACKASTSSTLYTLQAP